MLSLRLAPELEVAIRRWADLQSDKPSRSEAIRRILEFNLKVSKQKFPDKIREVSTKQLKAARSLLAWSQEQLAAAAEISVPTIKRLEAQDGLMRGRAETGSKIRAALEIAGIEFIDENGGGPGVRLRKRLQNKGS